MNIALVYLVAGMSSRFGGKVKQFAKIKEDETLIEHSLKQALKSGFTKIIFVVGEKTEKLFKEKFKDNYKGIQVEYCFQKTDFSKRDRPWGTTDAVCSIKEIINCPFVICNGDDIYGIETFKILFNHLQNKKTCATVGYKLGEVLSENGGVNRGIFKVENGIVKSLKEEFNLTKENLQERGLNESSLSSQGIFALQPEVVSGLNKELEEFKKENQGDRKIECLLTEEITNLINQEKIILEIYPTTDKWFGVTHPEDELKIQKTILFD